MVDDEKRDGEEEVEEVVMRESYVRVYVRIGKVEGKE